MYVRTVSVCTNCINCINATPRSARGAPRAYHCPRLPTGAGWADGAVLGAARGTIVRRAPAACPRRGSHTKGWCIDSCTCFTAGWSYDSTAVLRLVGSLHNAQLYCLHHRWTHFMRPGMRTRRTSGTSTMWVFGSWLLGSSTIPCFGCQLTNGGTICLELAAET